MGGRLPRARLRSADEITAIIGWIDDLPTTIARAVEEQSATTAEMNGSVVEAVTAAA